MWRKVATEDDFLTSVVGEGKEKVATNLLEVHQGAIRGRSGFALFSSPNIDLFWFSSVYFDLFQLIIVHLRLS